MLHVSFLPFLPVVSVTVRIEVKCGTGNTADQNANGRVVEDFVFSFGSITFTDSATVCTTHTPYTAYTLAALSFIELD